MAATPTNTPPGELAHWMRIVQPDMHELLAAAATTDATDVSAVQRLRADWPADLVSVALELTAARRKAMQKFGDAAATMVGDVIGVEQATSQLVAAHKARRFAAAGAHRIVDLCCGIGGDAMSLARIAPVLAVDHSAVRAWMAGRNAACETLAGAAEDVDVTGAAVHLDPDRRPHGRRTWRVDDAEPGPALWASLSQHTDAVAIKLGPGAAFEELPGDGRDEIEVISEHGTLVQAVLWRGRLARDPGLRRATRLPDDVSFVGEADQPVSVAAAGRYIYAVDSAVERAGLLGAFCAARNLGAVHPKVGLLTSDARLDDPWLSGFTLDAMLPWRQAKVFQWLKAHGAGVVEVKTRGGVVNTDVVQRALRGVGETVFTVFVLRMDRKVFALIGRRLAGSE